MDMWVRRLREVWKQTQGGYNIGPVSVRHRGVVEDTFAKTNSDLLNLPNGFPLKQPNSGRFDLNGLSANGVTFEREGSGVGGNQYLLQFHLLFPFGPQTGNP